MKKTLVMIGLLAAAGCQSQSTAPPPPSASGQTSLPQFHGDDLAAALNSDDIATDRMYQISGALASYCANNHGSLPQTLDDLKEVPGLGASLDFSCPPTGQPFKYSPAGLYLPNQPLRIILWEPTPAHGGSRVCLLVGRTDPGNPIVTYVKEIPEAEFQKALPAMQ